MVKIELTEDLKPILLPFIEWKEQFNPNFKFEESVDAAGLKKQTRVLVPCLENGVVVLNDEDIKAFTLLTKCIEEKRPVSDETLGYFVGNLMRQKCHACGQEKPLGNFAKDPSTPIGSKYICKDCFNSYQREKHNGNLAQEREAGRLRVKRWYEKNPEHAREKARLSSARYRQRKKLKAIEAE